VSSLSLGFIIFICHGGQVATGRSWHSASLHCQALLFRQLCKPQRCGQGVGHIYHQKMTKGKINRLIGYGILVFVVGFFAGQFWTPYLLWLIPIGTIMTFTGVFFFFKTTNLTDEFTKRKNDDVLTYFWNVLVLKLWTFMFMVWMITMNVVLLTEGKI
jgi:hypothetical protein